jgi:GAF domain-containing protein
MALRVLILKTIVPRSFDAEEMAVLASFAHQAAISLENARLYSALEDRVKRLDTLTDLNRLISTRWMWTTSSSRSPARQRRS